MADAGCQRVVHGGMAKRALDSNRLQSSLRIEKTGHTQNRVQLALLKLNSVLGVTGFFNSQGTLHWIPIDCRVPCELKKPVTPRTEFSLSSASVVEGSFRLTFPSLRAAIRL